MADPARKRVELYERSTKQSDGDRIYRRYGWQLVDYNGSYGNFVGFEPIDCFQNVGHRGEKEVTGIDFIDPDSQMVGANSGTGGYMGQPAD